MVVIKIIWIYYHKGVGMFRNFFKDLARETVALMRSVAHLDMSNAEKRRKVAVELNSKFDIPYIPEWLEGIFFYAMIEIVYETVIKDDK